MKAWWKNIVSHTQMADEDSISFWYIFRWI